MTTKWLRNEHQRERYGVKSNKSLERYRKMGRLPPSQYPFGNRVPANSEAELDAWDRAQVRRPRPERKSNLPTTKRKRRKDNQATAAGAKAAANPE
jgi:hypothetical protein